MLRLLLLLWLLGGAATAQTLVKGYCLRVDDGPFSCINLDSSVAVLELDTALDASFWSPGLHQLMVRAYDNKGRWSAVYQHYFYVSGKSLDTNAVIGYRYWFGSAEADGVYVPLDAPAAVALLDLDLTVNRPEGADTLRIRVLDAAGRWSAVYSQYFMNVNGPKADFTPGARTVCVGDSISFENKSRFAQRYAWATGDGRTSTDTTPKWSYAAPGRYPVRLVAFNDSTFVPSDTLTDTVTVLARFRPELSPNTDTVLCPGDTLRLTATAADTLGDWLWLRDGQVIAGAIDTVFVVDITGDYRAVYVSAGGCPDTSAAVRIEVRRPAPPTIRQRGNLLYVLGGHDVQWFVDGEAVPDGVTDTIRTHFSGQYTVQATDSCGDVVTSPPFDFIYNSRLPEVAPRVRLLPNPARDVVTLEAEGVRQVALYDLEGRVLWRGPCVDSCALPVEGLAAGVYYVRVARDTELIWLKLLLTP